MVMIGEWQNLFLLRILTLKFTSDSTRLQVKQFSYGSMLHSSHRVTSPSHTIYMRQKNIQFAIVASYTVFTGRQNVLRSLCVLISKCSELFDVIVTIVCVKIML